MKQKIIAIGFISLLIIGISSCKKYEDGGKKNKARDLIISSWKLEEYSKNGVDQTISLLISNYVEAFEIAGVYSRSYNDVDGVSISESGVYAFDNDMNIEVNNVNNIDNFSAGTTTLSPAKYNITRLEDGHLWYSFESDGNTHEFHFVAL